MAAKTRLNSDFSSAALGGGTVTERADFADAGAGDGAGAGTNDWMDVRVETAMATAAVMVDWSATLSTWTAVRMDFRFDCASASAVEIWPRIPARVAAGALW